MKFLEYAVIFIGAACLGVMATLAVRWIGGYDVWTDLCYIVDRLLDLGGIG